MSLSHRLAAISADGPQTGAGKERMRGPTSTSNWVIPGLILCGDLPLGPKLTRLIDSGVQHFVDLRTVHENYVEGLQYDASMSSAAENLRYSCYDLQHCIVLGTTQAIAHTAGFLKGLIASAVTHDEVTYIHCTDGHSLTTVAACGILAFVYGLTGMKASAVAAQLHGCRQTNDGVHQLLNPNQKVFVRALAEDTAAISEGIALVRSASVGSSMIDHQAHHSSRGNSPLQQSIHSLPHLSVDALGGSMTQAGLSHGGCPALPQQHHGMSAHSGGGSNAGTPMRSQRFGSTFGSGGGETHFNIFSQEVDTTPKRRGRAAVAGRTVEAVHKPPTPQGGSGHSTPTRHHVSCDERHHGEALGMQQPDFAAHHVQRYPQHDGSSSSTCGAPQFVDPLPLQRVFIERRALGISFGLLVHGVTVVRVEHGSPAEAAGVLPGALLRAVDGLEFDVDTPFDRLVDDRLRVRLTLDNGYRARFVESGGVSPARCANTDGMTPSPSKGQQPQRAFRPEVPSACSSTVGERGSRNAPHADAGGAALPPCFNPRTDRLAIQGPTPHSNWVIRGRVCCGAHPDPRQKTFRGLVEQCFTTFVSLTETEQMDSYIDLYSEQTGLRELRVLHFPIPDGGVVSQARIGAFLEFVGDLCGLVRENPHEKVYIHCQRGHGRTGLVVSSVLASLYGLNGMRAVNLCDALHACRLDTEDRGSPENQEQRTFIISLLTQ